MQTRTATRGGILASLFTLLMLTASAPFCTAGEQVTVGSDGEIRLSGSAAKTQAPEAVVLGYNESCLKVRFKFPGLQLSEETTEAGTFVRLQCPRTPVTGETGMPALPVFRSMFRAPQGAEIAWTVDSGEPIIVRLQELGFANAVAPVEPREVLEIDLLGQSADTMAGSGDVDDDVEPRPASGVWASGDRVVLKEAGMLRGMQLHVLETYPVDYDAQSGTITFWPSIQVEVSWDGGASAWEGTKLASGMERVVLNPPWHAGPRGGELGNYLIITPEDFAGSAPLTQFVNAKTAQGFNVTTYTAVEGVSRTTIKSYIEQLWVTPDAPDYLLILGDARDALPDAGSNSIPAFVGGGTAAWWTDLPYACMDGPGDWYPDIAMGRFPVRTVDQLQNLVSKSLHVQGGVFSTEDYAKTALFVAGPDPEADAETLHDEIIDLYMTPNGIQSSRLYMESFGATTQDIADGLNAGAFLASYYGHCAISRWNTPAFSTAEIDNLLNEGLYPHVISICCNPAQYAPTLYEPGLHEYWLRVPEKGAASAYGPTRGLYYPWSTWADMYRCYMRSIYQDGIHELGAAANAAIANFVSLYGPEDSVSRNYAENFVYLGDPSLQLPEPPPQNYLIITAEDYVGSNPLKEFELAKEGMGFNVITHAVLEGTSNTAIKAYIQSLWGTPDQPDYVLLVGDTAGFTATSNTVPHWEGSASKHADTDWPYVCMDPGDDWYPDIPIGRFSVRTVSSLQNVVDKSLYVESGNFPDPDYVKRGAFLANPSTYGQAEPTHDWVIDKYFSSNDYVGIKLYSSQGADTQDVVNAVNSGALFTVYFGHSSSSGWWDPSFTQTEVNALTNAGLYGLAFGWSCNTAHYSYDECFGETWLRASNKGAAAYISASDYIYWGSVEEWLPSVVLEQSFFTSIFHDDNWNVGPAWMGGLYRFLKDYGAWDGNPSNPPTQNQDVCRNFFEEFVILGDPALRLPQPDGLTLQVEPAGVDVCAPVEAVYTVSVGRSGDFSEAVTLSATGTPPGTNIEFSLNGVIPPFVSTMTVHDTDLATPGSYNIQVSATSATASRTQIVQLGIADSAPGTFSLASPENGAVDVARDPTLSWQAPPQAGEYEIELATDAQFNNVVYSAIESTTSHKVSVYLEGGETYYWHVRSGNGCGTSNFTPTFSFTTIDQPDYFTEMFTGGGDSFDLGENTLVFAPDGSGDYYAACLIPATALPVDPSGGTVLTLSDDGSRQVSLGSQVVFYGNSYSSLYVNANGNITFGQADGTWTETLAIHFDLPRIAALFDDLNPTSTGTVSWKETAEGVAVTWQGVPEFNTSNSNTFQVQILASGEVRITWLGIASADSIVGLSQGNGQPVDYLEMDLSAFSTCSGYQVGACCTGDVCTVMTEAECLGAAGEFLGPDTTCDPNPCITYNPACLIISEVVQGQESGDCPRWIEITNTGSADFAFLEGGVIVQTGSSSDVTVDVDLTGVSLAPGQSFVINSNVGGVCTGAYSAVYPNPPDMHTDVPFGTGDERFILTDTADGSHLIDIYGRFGIDSTGEPWEFTAGYSYSMPDRNACSGRNFAAMEWYFGGVDSLAGANPTQLLLTLTTPGTHEFNDTCLRGLVGDIDGDGVVDMDDCGMFTQCLAGPELVVFQPGCDAADFLDADLDGDNDVDLADFGLLQMILTGAP